MTYEYQTRGTCSRKIKVDLEGDIIREVEFTGGCNGNTKGLSAIVKGMKAQDVIDRFQGITCGFRKTSCPDQLAKALEQALASQA